MSSIAWKVSLLIAYTISFSSHSSLIHCLIGLKHVCSAYDFVKNPEQNLIVMDLLGKFHDSTKSKDKDTGNLTKWFSFFKFCWVFGIRVH